MDFELSYCCGFLLHIQTLEVVDILKGFCIPSLHIPMHSLPHSLTPSLPHSLTPSLPHSLTPSLPHSLTPSLYCITTDVKHVVATGGEMES